MAACAAGHARAMLFSTAFTHPMLQVVVLGSQECSSSTMTSSHSVRPGAGESTAYGMTYATLEAQDTHTHTACSVF
jgi:hypothetical protein